MSSVEQVLTFFIFDTTESLYMLRPLRNFCRSTCLRSLRLISCNDVTDMGFTEVVKALPLLEDLELSLCDNVGADGGV